VKDDTYTASFYFESFNRPLAKVSFLAILGFDILLRIKAYRRLNFD